MTVKNINDGHKNRFGRHNKTIYKTYDNYIGNGASKMQK